MDENETHEAEQRYEHTLDELMEQKAQLEHAIEARRAVERNSAIDQARALIEKFGISAADLYRAKRGRSKAPAAAKYANPETGATWTGRGRAPDWIKDLSKEDRAKFAVAGA